MRNLVTLMGKPGAGKDTQVNLLGERQKLNVIRVGDEVRRQSKTNPILNEGQKSGELANVEMVNNIVLKLLSETKSDHGIVIDGYPRSIDQAEFLEKTCQDLNLDFKQVIFVNIPDEEVVSRLSLRGRVDDHPEILKNRLAIFNRETQPVIDRYKNKNMLVEVDGVGSVEDIHQRILKVLNIHEDTN